MQYIQRQLATAILVGMTVMTAVTPAQARGFGQFNGYAAGSYIGLDGSAIDVDTGADDEIRPLGARLRLGTRLARNFDLEAQFGGGTDNDVDLFDRFSAAYIGVYLKGYLPIGRYSALFGLAGASAVELTQRINNSEFRDDRAGFSFGFGLETQLSSRFDLSADFMRYSLDDDEFSEVSAVNLGLKYYF